MNEGLALGHAMAEVAGTHEQSKAAYAELVDIFKGKGGI